MDAQTGWYLVLTKPKQENTAQINLKVRIPIKINLII